MIKKAEVKASACINGISFFEVRFLDENDKYAGYVYIPLVYLKELGVAQRLNGFKKVDQWLQTKEGLNKAIELFYEKNNRIKDYMSV